jgi:uncharacterized protein YecE (DUF72 family)
MVHVGTSGWSYPSGRGTWNGIFYPARRPRGFDELAYYAEHFDTVEVNSTFYRMPEPDLSAAWDRRTPASFLFAVKLFQKFTHPDMYLARDGVRDWDLSRTDVDLFRRGIDPLASAGKLAAVLIQFPTSFHADPDRVGYVDWLLDGLRGHPLVVELRHRSWYESSEATAALLAAHGATWAIVDAPRNAQIPERIPKSPNPPISKSSNVSVLSPVYYRLHGRNAAQWWQHEDRDDRYNYLYSASELAPFAGAAREAASARPGRRVVMYMNNHFSAKAAANAALLKHALGQPVPGDYPREMLDRYPELAGVVATSGLPL